jgi:hypothetical protein
MTTSSRSKTPSSLLSLSLYPNPQTPKTQPQQVPHPFFPQHTPTKKFKIFFFFFFYLLSFSLYQNKPPKWLVHIPRHPWVLGQAMGIWTHLTQHGPDSGEATTFPHIVFSAALRQGYIQVALFPGTPKLESRNCPEIVLVGVPGLWELITPDCGVRSQRRLNQSYSPRPDLSNSVSHSQFGCR